MEHGTKGTVLLLIETLNRGGIENVLLRLIPRLKEEGWSGTVVTIGPGGEMASEYKAAGITVISLSQTNIFSFKALRLIYKQIQVLNPDLIMTNLFKADLIGRIVLRFFVRQPVVPYLVTTYNHRRYWIARVFEWITKPLASHYIANSEAVQLFYEKRLGVKRDKIVVAPNGVDTNIFEEADGERVRKELGLPGDAFVVTCVANLAPNKGQADLLDAFECVFGDTTHAYLLLVGDGAERENLTAQRDTLHAKDRILLLGRRTDVPALLKITTVFALPTLFEGMSTALLEAMAAAKAIVTTNIPENKVLLTHNKTALMIAPSDRKGLAAALKKMYTEPELRSRFSGAAFDYVGMNYSISHMAKTFAEIFSSITLKASKSCVLHVISSLGSGGAENMLLRTLPLLNQGDSEHEVITLFQEGELASEFRKNEIPVVNIGLKNVFDIAGLRRLVREVKERRPGLIVTYLFHASLIGRLYLRNRVRSPIIPFLRSTYNFPRYAAARMFERVTRGLVWQYFANSEAVKDYYVTYIGVQASRITVIPNGIDISLYNRASITQTIKGIELPKRRTVISCVANFAKNKGHAYLLEAFEGLFKLHPDIYLLLIGEGEQRTALEQQIESYDSKSHIHFLGRRSDIPELLGMTDIFVLPTFFEGLSNALLEAMAAQCAIITTDIPENRVVVKDNKTGLLVPVQDAQALQGALQTLITDTEKRELLSQNAYAFVSQKFDLKQVANQMDTALRLYAKK